MQLNTRTYGFILAIAFLFFNQISFSQLKNSAIPTIEVGVASIDITPEGPIRLAGYGARSKTESTGVIQKLYAKAMAFGSDADNTSVLITVDLVGITWPITSKLAEQLATKAAIKPDHLVICASHTHGGPEIGNLLNILQYRPGHFSDSLLSLDQLNHISQYREQLIQKLEEVALAALKNRKPALVAWGQGKAGFAKNRRTEGGPVDASLPIIRVTNPDGSLRAVLLNYACHGTTMGGDINEVHGDWIGEAQKIIEANHPGVIALVALGCAADANPAPRGKLEDLKNHGQEISDNVDKLLSAQLQTISSPPVVKMKWVQLPFEKISSVPELIELTADKTVKGYYARLAVDRILRGDSIPAKLDYPIQVWSFDNKMAMVNLAGEVVVDYAIRLKNELGADHLWINAYANDVPCYIASKRVIKEGGYEAESSMYYYDKPSPFAEEVEDIIVNAVHDIIPPAFKEKRASANQLEMIHIDHAGEYHLTAAKAQAIGPNMKYMPEWNAFGWFNNDDRAEWDVQVDKKGKYDVYMEWSVDDAQSGKGFLFEAGSKSIKGKFQKTGSSYTFRKEKIGTTTLPAGQHKMVLKGNSASEKGAMMDLRQIVLVPAKR